MEPSSQQAFAKAAGLMILMDGAWQSDVLGVSEVGLPTGGLWSGSVSAELGGAELVCLVVHNVILLDTQSINGL